MSDIISQAENLYFRSGGARRKRVEDIANRYLENTAKANKVDARSVIDGAREYFYGMADKNPADSVSATRRQRMGLANG